jgi:uncharacterized protein YbbK (DUF523 family)
MDSHPNKKAILVSACLTGSNSTFRGTNNLNDKVVSLARSARILALCPEVFGGLGVPRENIELVGGDGNDVLDGKARAITASGADVTSALIEGSKKVLQAARNSGVKEAILKSNSPTCGSGRIYDGTFSKRLTGGYGVLAALLKRNGISVRSEEEV